MRRSNLYLTSTFGIIIIVNVTGNRSIPHITFTLTASYLADLDVA
jgi:hypothetical protein